MALNDGATASFSAINEGLSISGQWHAPVADEVEAVRSGGILIGDRFRRTASGCPRKSTNCSWMMERRACSASSVSGSPVTGQRLAGREHELWLNGAG